MTVPDGPALTEDQYDRLVKTIPDLTAKQLWDVAATFDHRIVALPKGGTADTGSSTERARQGLGFRA